MRLPKLGTNSAPHKARAVAASQRFLASAAAQENVAIAWHADLGTPLTVRGAGLGLRRSFSAGKGLAVRGGGRYTGDAIAVMDNLSGIFGIADAPGEFTAVKTEADTLGFHHVRLVQRHRGLRVVGGDVIVHFNTSSDAYEVNGRYVPDITLAVAPRLSAQQAMNRAKEDLAAGGRVPLGVAVKPELVVFALNTAPQLAYAVTLAYTDPTLGPGRWQYYVNADHGGIIMRYNDIKTIAAPTANGAHTPVTGSILAGEGGQQVTVTGWYENANASYYLYNTNLRWHVYNVAASGYPDANTYAFKTTNVWSTSDRSEMSLAYDFNAVQMYYRQVHGRRSYDGNGMMARANAHEGVNYVNAYWDSTDFHFGDGDNVMATPLAVLDIAGHEFTHAVDEYSADLIYANESGALNESFSDIFGTLIEFWQQPDGRAFYPGATNGYADWLCGEDSWLSSTALRDLRNPANTATIGAGNQQPSRYHGSYWDPYEEVHQNDGVHNFMFYLLAEGGIGNNDGLGYAVAGIGIANAGQVAYRALTVYCTPSTGYRMGLSAWLSAAADLNTGWVASVKAAWSAVGINSHLLSITGAVQFSGTVGGPFLPSPCVLTVSNLNTTATLAWEMSTSATWLQLAPTNGIIPADGVADVNIGVTSVADAFEVGTYTNALVFSNITEGVVETLLVVLRVLPPPVYTFPLDTNPGWTVQDQWAFGSPLGLSGDPSSGYTGTNVYGYNLAGDYPDSMTQTCYLTTTALDFSNYRNVQVSFRRWLGIESALFDHAIIQASRNGTTWSNVWVHTGGSIEETAWQDMTYDLSTVADGQPTVYLRWGMGPTDSSVTYCGWNIDDIVFRGVTIDDLRISPPGSLDAWGYEGGPFAPDSKNYMLSNAGASAVTWEAASAQPWAAIAPSNGVLSPGDVTTVVASLTADVNALATGEWSSALVFTNASSGRVQTRVAHLTVEPIPGEISVLDSLAPGDDLSMLFGAVLVGLPRIEQVTVTNEDPVHALVVTGINAPTGPAFRVEGAPPSFPAVLAPGAALAFSVICAPLATGDVSGMIVISSTDSNEPAVNLSLSATALPDDLRVEPSAGLVSVGPCGGPFSPGNAQYVVSNAGGVAIAWAVQCTEAWIEASPSNGTMAAGDSMVVTVAFAAAAAALPYGSYSTAAIVSNELSGAAQTRSVQLLVEAVAHMPFIEDFERGSLTSYWKVTGTYSNRTQVTSLYSPHGGTYHATMDNAANNGVYTRNELTLTIDLADHENLQLSFWACGYGDEGDPPPAGSFTNGADFDGVAISQDGLTWYAVQGLDTLPSTYTQYTVDLDAAIAARGLSYSRTFKIRFNQYDNYALITDGIGVDDIGIKGDVRDDLSVTPTTTVNAYGYEGGPFTPTGVTYVVNNRGDVAVAWQAFKSAAWLDISSTNGSLDTGCTTTVSLMFNDAACDLTPGTYRDTLVVSNGNTGAIRLRELVLQVNQMPVYTFPLDTNPGWTVQGQWAFGRPLGLSGDPSGGYTGTNVYGYNLAGCYSNSMTQTYYLTTRPLDFTRYTNVTVTFKRWLGIEASLFDHATIQASRNGTTWSNVWVHTGGSIEETAWQDMTCNISAVADGKPTVYLRWGMGPTDGSVTYCGWNIDDISFCGSSIDHLGIQPSTDRWFTVCSGVYISAAAETYLLTNDGHQAVSWSATNRQPWLVLEPVTGSLAAGDACVLTASLTAAALTLPPGQYNDTVSLTNLSGGVTQNRGVILSVLAPPFVDITNLSPAILSYHVDSFILGGTNNVQVKGGMWWTNTSGSSFGPVARTAASNAWTCTVTGLLEGSNLIRVFSSNLWNIQASDSIALRRCYERDLPMLDPLAPGTVREHQVLLLHVTGRTNVAAVSCNAAAVNGTSCFNTNTWRFSCVPDFNTASQVWNIAFVGRNQYGADTQTLVVTVAPHAKKITPKKPLLFEDEDGDLLALKYSGIKKNNSVLVFDGQNIGISNAYADGTLSFGIKRNKKTGGDGSFILRDVTMDGDGKSASLAGNVDNVTAPRQSLGSLKFTSKTGVASNIWLGWAKTISAGKGMIVGTVAVSNGFETLSAGTISGARILAGVAATADVTNTAATAGFKTVKATTMNDSIVAARDTMKGDTVATPEIKVKTAAHSTFFHTGTNNAVTPEPILP